MNIENLYRLFEAHPTVTTDTRNCLPGAIFIALKGENFNGNSFIHQALEAGCAYAVTDEAQYAVTDRIIPVDDCLKTLQQLANCHRQKMGTPIIGITGTNGKTTTKELAAAVLSSQYHTLYTRGNLNNHIGVPLTLLQLKPEHEIAIIEMGANHPGEIKTLADIAMPDYGLITNVGKAHLEGFGSFEGVIRTKGELYDYVRETKGKIFIHHENPYLNDIAQGIDKVFYGQESGSFVWGNIAGQSPFTVLDWHCAEGSYHLSTQLIGAYNLDNILAAIAIGKFFGITPAHINEAIAGYRPQNNRSQLKETAHNHLIVDAYNANPASMMAALENFRDISASRKALILGDMRELGGNSREEHRKVVDFICAHPFERVFLCGACFSEAASGVFPVFPCTEQLVERLKQEHLQGYYVLIKGSRGMEMEKCIEVL
ncbi:MAG: UDP-N-acetylmuramoyl-tripeptide--D-alanyl-D-alanine ligase [Dysgonamonadaceae bacterium]|nr:UDP-N-acetylmuramoyl-tripeptide--D-alanyl-D-alanine ligase [Dysgonamonadaceae bacterium]